MWLTNSIVDEMRHAILLKLSFKNKDLVVDEIPVQTIVKYYQPHALLFAIKTSIPGMIATVAPGVVSVLAPAIKTRFNL
jgi:hypothetical protein